MDTRAHAIRLIGGPFDGYSQQVAIQPEHLAGVIALPVNANVFLMLDGREPDPALPARTVALYALEDREGMCYEFIGSRRPQDLHLEYLEI